MECCGMECAWNVAQCLHGSKRCRWLHGPWCRTHQELQLWSKFLGLSSWADDPQSKQGLCLWWGLELSVSHVWSRTHRRTQTRHKAQLSVLGADLSWSKMDPFQMWVWFIQQIAFVWERPYLSAHWGAVWGWLMVIAAWTVLLLSFTCWHLICIRNPSRPVFHCEIGDDCEFSLAKTLFYITCHNGRNLS